MNTIPLVRTCSQQELWECFDKGGLWLLSDADPDRVGDQVMVDCKQSSDNPSVFGPCAYFFAGKVYPDFPEIPIVFVYGAGVENNMPGFVSPFDTGGLWIGKIHPYHKTTHPDDKTRHTAACQLIASTCVPVEAWREAFALFVTDFFKGDTKNYLARHDPEVSQKGCWDPNLPVYCCDNLDLTVGGSPVRESRAWTWEIRLHNAIPMVNDHLQFATADPPTIDELGKWIITQREHVRRSAKKAEEATEHEREKVVEAAEKLFKMLRQPWGGTSPAGQYDYIVEIEREIAQMI